MENKHKQFKPFDKVLVRQQTNYEWECDLYSHYNATYNTHVTIGYDDVESYNIIPYEGNEHLIGIIEEPEIKLKRGEWVYVCDRVTSLIEEWKLRSFDGCRSGSIYAFNNISASLNSWLYVIRFSDFNPYDMEETRKHILCVKNGKVVRYKK